MSHKHLHPFELRLHCFELGNQMLLDARVFVQKHLLHVVLLATSRHANGEHVQCFPFLQGHCFVQVQMSEKFFELVHFSKQLRELVVNYWQQFD